ncbi:hypothetical protein FOQG_09452 [Fusarium oxysporum f. sp. raphani 54005]|uniref:Secreted protein n=4 Tax=Fusarium oxysporum TaxID=5507 RepID=X0C8R6_FUSOX|nr:hypothetical protein FOVG_06485 [Fusarium oxysporum f. sp. pisi HDV247]EXK87204.1 hypothetical protein FOQG_09452 [Fusarium oxysporum f. sp. raphani 54005]EXL70064.1 hypothetical protein FOPG_14078 [Fusarium oxysporum f. sp. conglutinans race 2 54008]EXM22729.1 hypothetical protein FOTG_09889 [Fusarium oxysporum f. sp. vasinfectum 25433]
MLLFCAVSAFIHLHVSCNTFSLIRLCTRYGEFKGPGSTAQTITGSTQGHDPVLLGNSFIFQVAIFQPLLLADILTIPHDVCTHGRTPSFHRFKTGLSLCEMSFTRRTQQAYSLFLSETEVLQPSVCLHNPDR